LGKLLFNLVFILTESGAGKSEVAVEFQCHSCSKLAWKKEK